MRMFLAVSSNTGDPTPYLAAEGARMAELQQSGLVETLLLKVDWSGAVLLMQAQDEEAARSALDTLPLVTHGITSFALIEVMPPPEPPPA